MLDLNYFQKLSNNNLFIAGVDEVGRGPLAGPVVAACVLAFQKEKNEDEFISFIETLRNFGVTDSKKINADKRKNIIESFSLSIKSNQKLHFDISENFSIYYYIQEISVDEIDNMNILNAALKAMKHSFEEIHRGDGILLIDGNKKIKTDKKVELETIVKGDTKSLLIGLASIIAKEYRDTLMEKLDELYPGYNWSKNAGYGTKKHLEAIVSLGVTPVHRKTFKGVKEFCENGNAF